MELLFMYVAYVYQCLLCQKLKLRSQKNLFGGSSGNSNDELLHVNVSNLLFMYFIIKNSL